MLWASLTGWVMIEVFDAAAARQALARRRLRCPNCASPLRPWGQARQRTVRDVGGAVLTVRPDRARCTGCDATHVVLDARLLPNRAYTVEVVGAALLHAARGHGHRHIAALLDVPHDTVRGWVRRVRRSAQHLWTIGVRAVAALHPDALPTLERADPLAYAVDALAAAATALNHRLQLPSVGVWARIAVLTHGQLLAFAPSG